MVKVLPLIPLSLHQTCGKHVNLDQPQLHHERQVWHGTDEFMLQVLLL